MGTTIANLNVVLAAVATTFIKEVEKASKAADAAGKEFERMYRRASAESAVAEQSFQKAFKFASSEAALAERQMAAMHAKAAEAAQAQARNVEALGQGATQAGGILTGALTVPILGTAAAAVTMAAKLEAAEKGLASVSGSSEATAAKLAELREVSKLPGLGFIQAIEGQTRLQAAGLSADVATLALRGFGNAIAIVGGGKAELDGVTLALGQIASKGKISAEEINQLAERVPQIRQAMIAAFGTADTEALQKMGIGAEQFIQKVTTELEKLPMAAGGIKNTFENLNDSLLISMARIGEVLAPLIERAAPLLEKLIAQVERAAQWFGELPQPVQNFAIALAGIAAVVGPVLLAVGSLMSVATALAPAVAAIAPVLGVSAGALAGWGVAIVAAGAALAALGVWVYDNWEPIKATLMQAWAGIAEYWAFYWESVQKNFETLWGYFGPAVEFIFGPVVKSLGILWDAIGSHWGSVWDGISGFLSALWSGIVTVAGKAWNAVVGAIDDAIKWIRQHVPGMEKLLTLDKAWDGAKRLEAAQKEVAAAVKSTERATNSAKPKFEAFAGAHGKVTAAAGVAKTEHLALERQLAATRREVEATKKELDALGAALTKQKEFNDLVAASDALTASLQAQAGQLKNVSSIEMPAVVAGIVTAVPEVTAFADEFGTVATKAEAALGSAGTELSGWVSNAQTEAGNFRTQFVDKILGGFQDIVPKMSSLLTGAVSLSKIGSQFKQLGLDALDLWFKPMQDAITGPQGIIQQGLTALTNKLLDVQGLTGQIFGGLNIPGVGGGGGGSTPGAPSGGGGGGGFSGGGGDPLSAVTGVITAISSVWGNFQNLEIESGIDLIEENTRWLKRGLVELPDSLLNQFKAFAAVFGTSGFVTYYMIEMDGSLNAIQNSVGLLFDYSRGFFSNAYDLLDRIAGRAAGIQSDMSATKAILQTIRDRSTTLTFNITVNASGSSSTSTQTVTLNQAIGWGVSP
jgi:tape measure domain-containing protein